MTTHSKRRGGTLSISATMSVPVGHRIAIQRGGPCPQPHAGAGIPELCSHRLTPNEDWGRCVHISDPCTTLTSAPILVGGGLSTRCFASLMPESRAGEVDRLPDRIDL